MQSTVNVREMLWNVLEGTGPHLLASCCTSGAVSQLPEVQVTREPRKQSGIVQALDPPPRWLSCQWFRQPAVRACSVPTHA